ncbi:MAG: hypothetical protein ABL933_12810 [Methyloglobulus sp.]|nr:hypothetical protein [Methyloglobulus sp.]
MSEDLRKNSNQTNQIDSDNEVNTKLVVRIIVLIVLVVVGIYFYKFHFDFHLSDKNDVWGTFGDYVGGILNPVIAAFAFYLIAESYKLQKRELEAARELLKRSTEDQNKQVELAAVTAWINSNFSNISFLQSQIPFFWKEIDEFLNDKEASLKIKGLRKEISNGPYFSDDPATHYDLHIEHQENLKIFKDLIIQKDIADLIHKIDEVENEVNRLNSENRDLKKKIQSFIPDSKRLHAARF